MKPAKVFRTPLFWFALIAITAGLFFFYDGSGGYQRVDTSAAETLIREDKVDKAEFTSDNVLQLDLKDGQTFSDGDAVTDATQPEQHARREGHPVERVVADGQGLPHPAEHDLLVRDQAGETDGVHSHAVDIGSACTLKFGGRRVRTLPDPGSSSRVGDQAGGVAERRVLGGTGGDFLLGNEGTEVPDEEAKRLGVKAKSAPANKAKSAPANKGK